LFSWQFLLFCLAIAAVLFVIRRVFEYALDNWKIEAKNSKLWKDLILPILPVFLGPTAAYLAEAYPYPNGLDSASARIDFGLVVCLLSGLVYRVLKSSLGYRIKNPVNNYSYGYNYNNYGVNYNSVMGAPDAPIANDFGDEANSTGNKDQ